MREGRTSLWPHRFDVLPRSPSRGRPSRGSSERRPRLPNPSQSQLWSSARRHGARLIATPHASSLRLSLLLSLRLSPPAATSRSLGGRSSALRGQSFLPRRPSCPRSFGRSRSHAGHSSVLRIALYRLRSLRLLRARSRRSTFASIPGGRFFLQATYPTQPGRRVPWRSLLTIRPLSALRAVRFLAAPATALSARRAVRSAEPRSQPQSEPRPRARMVT
jgi:hypothetical protein